MRIKPLRLVPPESPTLVAVAADVEPSGEMYDLAKSLALTARRFHGLAVAAPQVGRSVRLVGTVDGILIANPRIVGSRGTQIGKEGCLTWPGRFWTVERAEGVDVEGISPRDGSVVHLSCNGLLARLWQHEIDHLAGMVLLDRFPEATRLVTTG